MGYYNSLLVELRPRIGSKSMLTSFQVSLSQEQPFSHSLSIGHRYVVLDRCSPSRNISWTAVGECVLLSGQMSAKYGCTSVSCR